MKRKKPMKRKAGNRPEAKAWQSPAGLSRDVQAEIGDQLRAMHDDIVREGVPDRFVDLLARLDQPKQK